MSKLCITLYNVEHTSLNDNIRKWQQNVYILRKDPHWGELRK